MKYISTTAFLLSLAGPSCALPAPAASPAASSSDAAEQPWSSGSSDSLYGSKSLIGYAPSNKIPIDTTVVPPDEFTLGTGQSADPNLGLYIDLTKVQNPQPIRGGTTGPTDPGPRTADYDRLNSDLYAPPASDMGEVKNAKWPFSFSHNRHGLAGAGWARSQNVDQLPVSTAMAGTNMRLSPNAYRELHWHKQGEWALMLEGSVRIQATNEKGETFIDDLTKGDVWFFPPGIPHSLQARENGCEFLLVFDEGTFDEENTFLLSEMMMRNPKSVLAKNFKTSVKTFDPIPDKQLWIFPGTQAPSNISEQNVTGPAGSAPIASQYSYHFSEQEPLVVPGGSIKILDPTVFPVASMFSTALVTIEPGAMREMHWHTNSDEWSYILQGSARLTVYSAPSSSRTFDFQAGDVGYVPFPNAHYLENTGNETLVFLEVLQAKEYSDISVSQWLGLTPKQIVKDHLNLDDAFLDTLPKKEQFIVPGNPDLTTTDFTDSS